MLISDCLRSQICYEGAISNNGVLLHLSLLLELGTNSVNQFQLNIFRLLSEVCLKKAGNRSC